MTNRHARERILVADIGATRTRLASWERDALVDRREIRTDTVRGWSDLLSDAEGPHSAMSVAIAGPVDAEGGGITNGELVLRVADAPLPVRMQNDLEAAGRGLAYASDDAWMPLTDCGRPDLARGPIAVLGVGTGLGMALVLPDGSVRPSEGGHADFAARTEEEWALAKFIIGRRGRATVERVLSGGGLADVLEWASTRGVLGTGTRARLQAGEPAGRVILESRRDDEASGIAWRVFVSALGAEAGNIALRGNAWGGVALCGGVTISMAEAWRGEPAVVDAFLAKGRFSELLRGVPLAICASDDLALYGAAALALADEGLSLSLSRSR